MNLRKVRTDAWGAELADDERWEIYRLTRPPREGEEDRPVVRTYEDACRVLEARGITPPSRAGWFRFLARMRQEDRLQMIYAVSGSCETAGDLTKEAKVSNKTAAERFFSGIDNLTDALGLHIRHAAGGARGTDPFSAFIKHQKKQIVLLATGGTLMSLAEAGAGTLAGNAQSDVWHSIVARDSAVIAQAVNRALLRPYLERTFPGQPAAVQFGFDFSVPPTPKEVFEVAALAKQAGYVIDVSELEEQTGYTLKVEEQPQGQVPGAGCLVPGAPQQPFANKEQAETTPSTKHEAPSTILAAFAKDTGPAADAIRKLLDDPSPEAAAALLKDLPNLIPDDPALAAVIADAMAEEFGKTVANKGADRVPAGNGNGGQFTGATNQPRGKEPETKPQHDRYGSTDEKTLSSEPQKNFKRGSNALEAMERMQGGYIDKAMYREETGLIRFDWGDPGDPAKDYKHGHGISHVLAKHHKDAKKLPEVLADGRAVTSPDEPDKTYLVTDTAYAVVIPLNQSQRRILTMFEPKQNSKKLAEIKNYPPAPKRQGR